MKRGRLNDDSDCDDDKCTRARGHRKADARTVARRRTAKLTRQGADLSARAVARLIRYIENGNWPISNNPCENSIRPFVVARKSFLFADTVAGAHASANLYSLVKSAKANGIDPYCYLTWLFQRLPLAKTVDDYDALLPWKMPANLR